MRDFLENKAEEAEEAGDLRTAFESWKELAVKNQDPVAPEVVQKIIVSLSMPPAKLEDLQNLHSLVMALEREVESVQTQA